MSETNGARRHVVIVGGGFAGLGCARRLANHDDGALVAVSELELATGPRGQRRTELNPVAASLPAPIRSSR